MNETIFIKRTKCSNFTTVDNGFIQNKNLSWKAKGIFLYFLSLPNDWVINQNEIETHSSDGISSLRAGIEELKNNGYLKIEKVRNEKGQITGSSYQIDEFGTLSPEVENPKTVFPKTENLTLQNTNTNKKLNEQNISDFPQPEDYEEKKETKKSFTRKEYLECISLINSCKNTLKAKGVQIDQTEYPYPVLTKWLKAAFTLYGVENTKKGITNSVTNNWLVNNTHYSLSAMFSEKVFPQLISNQTSVLTTPNVNTKHHEIDYLGQDYDEGF